MLAKLAQGVVEKGHVSMSRLKQIDLEYRVKW